MPRHPVTYRSTNRFAPIVPDYLEGAEGLREFHVFTPDRAGLQEAMSARRFDPAMRANLCQAIERQYHGIGMHTAVRSNLDALRQDGTLTVSTGHQLCLFTGPLYMPFKILNVIRLARELATAQHKVVPIFWMASEDHDRVEIDHTWINGKQVSWPGEPQGAVGRMALNGIDAVVKEAGELLGSGTHAEELRGLLRDSYHPHHTLAQATRLFVNALFGRYGLIIVDGDDAALKKAFAPIMQEELLNEVTARAVSYANEKLEPLYKVQAHAREINLFHLREGHRSRIVREGDGYRVLDGGSLLSIDQLLVELQLHPEHFSPNVLMRPLYQETVLPNVAYVGGGAEVAYWLQLRWLFQAFQMPMPVVLLRTSALLLAGKDMERWSKLGLSAADLFAPAEEIKGRVATSLARFSTDLGVERDEQQAFFDRLAVRVRAVDPSLEGTVLGGRQQTMKGLDHVEDKLVRAAKRQQETALQRVDAVLARCFPDGGLQERRENILPWYAQQGPAFFDVLLNELDPLDPHLSVLVDAQ